ncbi:MAG: transcription termination/antitermination protein NusA [Deltaproteobacteria bacterium]|nr:transcription termination/antitermination protein NusA [Deltaproteobacteria bacterium]
MIEGLSRIIEQVSREKGIPMDSLRETVEQALVAAARKVYGLEKDIEAQYNPESDEVELFEYKTVVEEIEDPDNEILLEDARKVSADNSIQPGEEIGLIMELENFGRIAAQTAKQVIIQRVRDSEREKVFDAYKDRVGELITGIVRRFEKGAIIVDLGKSEAVIPAREQVRTETYRQGDRIQAYILEVARNARGPQVVLSRTHPGLLVKLFEMEVPEIYEGIVTIEAAVREPGQRAKIAVSSRDSDVDPVGACVGMKGSRVQAVVAELRGEKIDIIPYSIDPARFVCSAISPAIVTKVLLDEDTRTMELIVPDDQLSLAIGRRGQNVRLAAKLTGWKIDIHSETKIREMNDEAREQLARVEGLTEDHRELLIRYGFRELKDVADAEADDLIDILAIDQALADTVIDQADDILTDELRAKYEREEENERLRAAGLPTLDEQEAAARAAEAAKAREEEIAHLAAQGFGPDGQPLPAEGEESEDGEADAGEAPADEADEPAEDGDAAPADEEA